VRNHVSHPYKIADEIIVLYILIFKFVERQQEDKNILNRMAVSIPQM
jgi:hypothetical protein